MTFHAVCFDLDGVIIDSEPAHENAFKDTLSSFDIALTHEQYVMCFAGKTDRKGFEDYFATRHLPLPRPLPYLTQAKASRYMSLAPTTMTSFSGTIRAARIVKDQHLRLALVTGSSKVKTDMILDTLNIHDYFETIISADDVDNGKPHPEPYTKAAAQL